MEMFKDKMKEIKLQLEEMSDAIQKSIDNFELEDVERFNEDGYRSIIGADALIKLNDNFTELNETEIDTKNNLDKMKEAFYEVLSFPYTIGEIDNIVYDHDLQDEFEFKEFADIIKGALTGDKLDREEKMNLLDQISYSDVEEIYDISIHFEVSKEEKINKEKER